MILQSGFSPYIAVFEEPTITIGRTVRYATCRHCGFNITVVRGLPEWWVTHRCPDGTGRIVLWERA